MPTFRVSYSYETYDYEYVEADTREEVMDTFYPAHGELIDIHEVEEVGA